MISHLPDVAYNATDDLSHRGLRGVCARRVRACDHDDLGAEPTARARLRVRTVVAGRVRPGSVDARVQFVVEQGGRIRVMRDGVLPAPISSTWRGRSRRRRARPARPGVRARLRPSGRFFVNFTEPIRPHGRRAVPAIGRSARRRSGVALRSPVGGRAAPRSSRSRSRITTAATWRSDRTAISTSGSATAAPATIRNIARRIRRSCSARCCAST